MSKHTYWQAASLWDARLRKYVSVDIDVTINELGVIHTLGEKALLNKSHQSRALHGAVTLKVTPR